MTYRIFFHENGEPVEKATANNRDEAIRVLMQLFRGRLQGLRPVHTGEDDYDLYEAFVDDGERVVAIEWD